MEIEVVKIENKSYPNILKKIPAAPQVLYIKGKMLQNENCFAIVGTRKCSDYGKEIAFSFAKELSGAGLTIISGLARGIDAFAHKGALQTGGRTIAVLGTGLSEQVIYPQENLNLSRQIVNQGGCLVSEYPSETHGDRFTFPERNRIISGLSLGVLVVEAKFGSGALITAKWAQKQNRKVFAVPGPIHSANSKGCHYLIREGAVLAERPEDILKELGFKTIPISQEQENIKDKAEQLILAALSKGGLHIDEIIEKTKLPPQKVSGTLSLLELNSKVQNLGGNVYAITH